MPLEQAQRVPYMSKHDAHFYDWFIFGEAPDGTVDIADEDRDVFQGLTREHAEKIIALRDRFLDDLRSIVYAV